MSEKCPKCDSENPDTQSFCGDCGTRLIPSKDIPAQTRTIETPIQELARGTRFADRYEIIEELGTGGMGKVYRVEDIKAKEEIALKLIKPEIVADIKTIERFRNELTTARKIRHKNICGMYDLGEDESSYYITMEYVPGEDLKSFIRRSKKLTVETTVFIGIQICEGLAEAHKLSVVHRDLKPSNIMIDKDGNVRIMDFGIARSLKEKGITGAGVMIGTPEYMSPEQVEAKDVDQRADIYSVGVILYEMVTGQVPFEGDTPFTIGIKHKSEIPQNPKELNAQIPDDLSRMILKCLEKDKEKRHQSAGEVRSELENMEKGISTTDRVMPKKRPITSKEITVTFGLKKFLIPAVAIAALAIITIIVLKFLPRGKSLPTSSEKTSVAILPFDDLSPQKDQEYLCDGLAETLINALSKIKSLHVPARASSFLFKDRERNYQEIGEKLDVDAILEGSIQKSEDRLRITTRLINTSNESLIWSEQYDREFGDIFEIQDEISLAIVNKLKVNLLEEEKVDLAKRYTDSVEAYQFYLRGKYYRYREIAGDYYRAKDSFEQAIFHDPNFAPAYAGLAEAHMMLGYDGYVPKDKGEGNAKMYAQKALDLAPNSSEAHSSMGVIVEIFDWNWEEAEQRFLHAIELNPNNFGAHWEYGLLLMRMNRHEEAERELLRALELDPLSDWILGTLVRIFSSKGPQEKAQKYVEKMKALGISQDKFEDTIKSVTKRIAEEGRLPFLLGRLGVCYAESGNIAEAKKLISELEVLVDTSNFSSSASSIAWIMSSLGDREKTFEWLNRAVERHDPALIETNLLPWLDGLRDDPRFKILLKEIGLE